jgi:predicted dienelactone hydrolase
VSAPNRLWRLVRRLLRVFAALAFCAVLTVGVLLGSLWLEHSFWIELPKPTGPFAVGRDVFDWVDSKTFDSLAPVAGTKRELLVWMWYPAVAGQSAVVDDYLPEPLRAAIAGQTGVLLSDFLTRDLSKVRGHSLRNADVSPQQQSYAVIIMRAGASLEVASYSSLVEDLASHGYIVVGVDAPYRTGIVSFPEGRIIKRIPQNNPEVCLEKTGQERDRCASRFLTAWNSDIAYVLDRLAELNTSDSSGKFTAKLDMTRVGIFGHSFGGAQATQFCSEDSRCKAGIDLDGAPHGSVIQTGINRPFMFLGSDHSPESDPETRQIKADIQSIYERIPVNERLYVWIRGANHFTFSDDGAVLKSHFLRGVLRVLGKLGIDGDRQIAVTRYCLRTFFDAYLKKSSGSPPELLSPLYPEIRVLK